MYGLYGFFFENCTDCTDFFLKTYGFFQKSFGHPETIFNFVFSIKFTKNEV